MRIAIAALLPLMVSGLTTAAHAQAPRGSYLRSCTDVRMRGDALLAVCRREDGRMQRTVLPDVDRCIGDIGNQNGILRCNRAEGPPPPPPGYGRHRHCRELAEEIRRLRDRLYHPSGPGERERVADHLRELDLESARRGCPPPG
ncbi:MAG TPA: hypothetical protein VJ770_00020 [Stellaceae bacterium]|nr:hypothetical protein [Stellaceae bacterium]